MSFLLGSFVFDGEHFQHLPCAHFSVAKLCDKAITAGFPIAIVVHSLLVLRLLSQISA